MREVKRLREIESVRELSVDKRNCKPSSLAVGPRAIQ